MLVFCQFVAGLGFVVFLYSGNFRFAGILEWTLTYLGTFWLLSFVGYTRCVVLLGHCNKILTSLLQNPSR